MHPIVPNHIVFAEDNEHDRELFIDVVQYLDSQIRIDPVTDGRQLMELLRHFCPDLLFLNLEMPYKNGLECLSEIRNNAIMQDLPVVVFSSTTMLSNIQTAYEMGAHLYLIKPQSFTEYTATLKAVLSLDWTRPQEIKQQYCIHDRYVAFS
jgi:DNA-binding response OmpR family regulator